MFRPRVERPPGRAPCALPIVILAIFVAACASPTASPSLGSGASHDPAPADFPLIGSWTTTITRDDLTAGGVTEDGLLNENSGVFTWVFEADGTWRNVQASLDGSPVMHPVFSGYYTVEDGVLVAVTEFPEEYRDDGLRYTFEVNGNSVAFEVTNPPDPMLPIIVESHPWTRTQP